MRSLTNVEGSSLFAAVGYDSQKMELTVKFKSSGDIYVYEGVTPTDWRDLCVAESKGGHFVKYIRNNFRCRKVEPEPEDASSSSSGSLEA